MRKAIIAGNWKMNKTPSEGVKLVEELKPLVADADCEVVVCVPATNIWAVGQAIKGSNIKLGAENVHWAESGAFTGEISLNGDILRVGGLKEKLIVAYNKGINIVYIPSANTIDLDELPKEITENIEIISVNNYSEIYTKFFK